MGGASLPAYTCPHRSFCWTGGRVRACLDPGRCLRGPPAHGVEVLGILVSVQGFPQKMHVLFPLRHGRGDRSPRWSREGSDTDHAAPIHPGFPGTYAPPCVRTVPVRRTPANDGWGADPHDGGTRSSVRQPHRRNGRSSTQARCAGAPRNPPRSRPGGWCRTGGSMRPPRAGADPCCGWRADPVGVPNPLACDGTGSWRVGTARGGPAARRVPTTAGGMDPD